MPGRTKPAGYVEGENAEVKGDQGKCDDGRGADARMGDIDLWLRVGGQMVFIV